MVNKTTVAINGRSFQYFIDIRIESNLENFGKIFRLSINVPQDDNFQININDVFTVEVDGERLMTGYIESFDCSATLETRIFNIQGRDIITDFTDSQLPTVVFKTPFNLIEALKKLITKCGFIVKSENNLMLEPSVNTTTQVAIINEYGDIPNFEDTESLQYIKKINGSSFEFIKNLTNRRGILLGTDGYGNIVIRKIGQDSDNTMLLCQKSSERSATNNIIDSHVAVNFQDRFYKYEYISSSSNGKKGDDIFDKNKPNNSQSIKNDLVRRKASVYDEEIRKNRIFTKYKSSLSSKQCEDYARWELNVRKAKSKIYKYKVFGFRQNLSENLRINPLWKINQLVYVYDESQYPIVDEELLIKNVIYKQDSKYGTVCELELVDKLAYTYSINEPLIRKGRKIGNKKDSIFVNLEKDNTSL